MAPRPALSLACLLSVAAFTECPPPLAPLEDYWIVPAHGWNLAPSADETTVYFGGFDHELFAVEKATGRVRWRALTGVVDAQVTWGWSTVVAADIVAMGDIDIFAYDRATGAHRWTFMPADLDVTGGGTLAVAGETIYAASQRNRIYAIDARTGAQRWMTQLPGGRESAAFDPVERDGLIIAGIKHFGTNPASGGVAALDAATGEIRWVRAFDPSYPGALHGCLGGAVFHGDNVIVGAEDGRIYALDRLTGEVRWTAPRVHTIPPANGGSYGDKRPLAIAAGVVMAGSTQGIVVGLDAATGVERWRKHASDFAYAGIRYSADQRTFFLTANGLFAIDAETGAVRWRRGALTEASLQRGQRQSLFISPALPRGDTVYVAGPAGFYSLRN